MQNHNFTRTHTRAALFTLVSAPAPSADGALTRADHMINGFPGQMTEFPGQMIRVALSRQIGLGLHLRTTACIDAL